MNPFTQGLRVVAEYDPSPKAFTERGLRAAMLELRSTVESEALLTEAATLDGINEAYNPGDDAVLEALTSTAAKLPKMMRALARVLGRHLDGDLTIGEPEHSKPRVVGAYASITVGLPVSDGQQLFVILHAPDKDPKKINPTDELIAYRWLLNKRDITAFVAPEEGKDVTLDTVAARVGKLISANSAAFVAKSTANKEAFAKLKATEASLIDAGNATAQAVAQIAELQVRDTELSSIEATKQAEKQRLEVEVKDLEARLAAARQKKADEEAARTAADAEAKRAADEAAKKAAEEAERLKAEEDAKRVPPTVEVGGTFTKGDNTYTVTAISPNFITVKGKDGASVNIPHRDAVEYWGFTPGAATARTIADVDVSKVTFAPSNRNPESYETVTVDVAKLDAAWAKGGDGYIGNGGSGDAIGNRYQGFIDFTATGEPVEMSDVGFNANGGVSFGNGRHRFAVLRDAGMKTMPVIVPKEDVARFKAEFGAGAPATAEDPAKVEADERNRLQMYRDMIATKKANGEAVPEAWVKGEAELAAKYGPEEKTAPPKLEEVDRTGWSDAANKAFDLRQEWDRRRVEFSGNASALGAFKRKVRAAAKTIPADDDKAVMLIDHIAIKVWGADYDPKVADIQFAPAAGKPEPAVTGIKAEVGDGENGWTVLLGAANGDKDKAATMTAKDMLEATWNRRIDLYQRAQHAGRGAAANALLDLVAEYRDAPERFGAALSSLKGNDAYRFLTDAMGGKLEGALKERGVTLADPTPAANPDETAAIGILNSLVAGDSDGDIRAFNARLDEAAAKLEAAGLMEKHDALLNRAADRLTEVLKKLAA